MKSFRPVWFFSLFVRTPTSPISFPKNPLIENCNLPLLLFQKTLLFKNPTYPYFFNKPTLLLKFNPTTTKFPNTGSFLFHYYLLWFFFFPRAFPLPIPPFFFDFITYLFPSPISKFPNTGSFLFHFYLLCFFFLPPWPFPFPSLPSF